MNSGSVLPPGTYPAGNYPTGYVVEESVWMRRGTWGSIVIGAVVGFAITVILATFGAATGLVAGAVAADKEVDQTQGRADRDTAPATSEKARDTARGAAVGGAVFLILTAAAAGIIGGMVAGRISQAYRHDVTILGLATWAVGLIILVTLVAFGASGSLGGLGAGAGEVVNQQQPHVDAETGRAALEAASYGAWGFFLAQLIGLGATLLGAKVGMKRRLKHHVVARTATP
jgi:hypothetical protein